MYMYGVGDEKWSQKEEALHKRAVKLNPLNTYTFCLHPLLQPNPTFDKDDVPIVFKASPDTLLNLCCAVVDAIKLPPVYEWSNLHVCRWIKQYGYPHFIGTFRDNHINGRTLLLLTASNLSAMNIKNFDDIRHIAYGIRQLFYFEMTKFSHSISLAPEYHYELYKLFRVRNGPKYEDVRRSDLWRRLQLIREKTPNYSHWELLERWLAMVKDPRYSELIGGAPRSKLYRCDTPFLPATKSEDDTSIVCGCEPPCECCWSTKRDLRQPWRLKCLPPQTVKKECPKVLDTTTMLVKTKWYLNSLLEAYPHKYGLSQDNRGIQSLMSEMPLSYTRLITDTKLSLTSIYSRQRPIDLLQ